MDNLLSYADLQERLVEAMTLYWRLPDRERGWLKVRSHWPDTVAEVGMGEDDAYGRGGAAVEAQAHAAMRPGPLTRRDMANMEEAFGWLEYVDPDDRKLIALAITQLARGETQVPWGDLLRPMGLKLGSHGLRRRYERALGALCRTINGGFARNARRQAQNQQG